MLENGGSADPFSAAPFNPKSKGRRRDQKLAGKYRVLQFNMNFKLIFGATSNGRQWVRGGGSDTLVD